VGKILRTLLSFLAGLILSPVASYLSGLVTVYRDASDPNGIVALQGFPVWFYKVDPDYSLMDRWQLGRLCINTTIWALFLAAIVWIILKPFSRKA
jgi:hypothetical protein